MRCIRGALGLTLTLLACDAEPDAGAGNGTAGVASAGGANEQSTAGESGRAGAPQGVGGLGGSSGLGGGGGMMTSDGGANANAGHGGDPGNDCGAAGSGGTPPPGPLLRMTTDPAEVTECTATDSPDVPPFADPQDECGCGTLSCAAAEICIRVVQPAVNALGGPDKPHNRCFALCTGDDDCDAPAHCVRNLYGLKVCAPACRDAGDCSDCMACNQGYLVGHAGAVYADDSQSRCAEVP